MQEIQSKCELHCDSDSFWPEDIKHVVPAQSTDGDGTLQQTRRRRAGAGKMQISASQAPRITKSVPQAPEKQHVCRGNSTARRGSSTAHWRPQQSSLEQCVTTTMTARCTARVELACLARLA
eukprot:gene8367-biopygen13664